MTQLNITDIQPDTTNDPDDVNARFDAVRDILNGNIDNGNLSAGANIDPTKLAISGDASQYLDGTGSWSTPSGGGGGGATDHGLVTALPGSPGNGDTCILVDSTTAPTYMWPLRYIAAASTYQWYAVGQAEARIAIATAQSSSSFTYTDLSTVGPSFTIPVSGDYDIGVAANMSAGSAIQCLISYAVGATAASDNWATGVYYSTAVSGAERLMRWSSVATTTVVTAKYRSNFGTTTWRNRELIIRPFRVG